MRRLRITLVMLLVVTAGCTSTPSPPAPELNGTAWVVTAIKASPTLSDKKPTMTFGAGRYSGTTGCNSYGGDATISGASVRLTAGAVTEMACLDDQVMAQEAKFLAVLPEVATVRTTSSGIELLNSAGQSLLSLTAATSPSPRPLIGTTWTLTTIRSGTSASSVVTGSTLTLTLAENRYSGKACNTFGGDLTLDGDRISFGTPHSTKMACPSAEQTAQESAVLGSLTTLTSWEITGDSLALSAQDGSGLDFVAS